MATKQKARTKKKQPQYDFSKALLGVIFLALTIYTGWIIFQTPAESNAVLSDRMGYLGAFIFRTMSSLAGTGKVIFPFVFCITGIFCVTNKEMGKMQIVGFVLACVTGLTFLHMEFTFGENSLALGWSGFGGGVIGASCAWLLSKALGQVGSYILLFCLAIIAVMLISQNAVSQKGDQWLASSKTIWTAIKDGLYRFIFVTDDHEEQIAEAALLEPKQHRSARTRAIPPGKEDEVLRRSNKDKPLIINNLTEIQKTLQEAKESRAVLQGQAAEDETLPEAVVDPAPVKMRKVGRKKSEIKEETQEEVEELQTSAPIIKVAAPIESASAKKKKTEEQEGFDVADVLSEYAECSYQYPSIDLLEFNQQSNAGGSQDEINERVAVLEKTLADFGVKGHIAEVSIGPSITQYEFQPAAGVKVSKIVNLSDDIALNMATAGVRIEAPIPGKAAVGIEIPNQKRAMVSLREVIDSDVFQNSESKLTVALGKDISGKPIIADLAKMPHLLIAGSTGSGKSVCMNALINSILFKAAPDEVKLLMVDPKMVELGNYNGIPHLISPVVTDPKKAAAALRWAVHEMERRYALFADHGVKDMKRFNALSAQRLEKAETEEEKAAIEVMPYIVVLIDELADLMMVAPADVEDAICRLAQLARAAGIHLVVATQRPSVDVITGIIKANLPSRIAFAVSSQIDSRTILDMGGAEKLLGKGDMLFYPTGLPKPVRVQGVYVSDQEIDRIVEATKVQGEPTYDETIGTAELSSSKEESSSEEDTDPLIPEAVKLFIESGQASISLLQRRFRVGYNRAARIIDQMEQLGLVGPYEGSKPRQVKITMEQYLQQNEEE